MLLRELSHAEGTDKAETDLFARRVLAELVRDNPMTEEETSECTYRSGESSLARGRQRSCTNGIGPAAARHSRRPAPS
jgi:hypothetical protein